MSRYGEPMRIDARFSTVARFADGTSVPFSSNSDTRISPDDLLRMQEERAERVVATMNACAPIPGDPQAAIDTAREALEKIAAMPWEGSDSPYAVVARHALTLLGRKP